MNYEVPQNMGTKLTHTLPCPLHLTHDNAVVYACLNWHTDD